MEFFWTCRVLVCRTLFGKLPGTTELCHQPIRNLLCVSGCAKKHSIPPHQSHTPQSPPPEIPAEIRVFGDRTPHHLCHVGDAINRRWNYDDDVPHRHLDTSVLVRHARKCSVTFNVSVVGSYKMGRRGQHGLEYHAYAVHKVHIPIRAPSDYRKRFGIESNYRQKNLSRIHTTTKNPVTRLL